MFFQQPRTNQTIQKLSLSVGFLVILLCLFLNNGIVNPNLENPAVITYYGKIISEYQGNTYKFDLECNGEGSNDVNKECQIFKQTFIFALISLGFGGAALLMLFRDKTQKLSILILLFILVPMIFTIMMPIWKIIYANETLTYKIAPIILEFISFISYVITISLQILLKQKYKSSVGLMH